MSTCSRESGSTTKGGAADPDVSPCVGDGSAPTTSAVLASCALPTEQKGAAIMRNEQTKDVENTEYLRFIITNPA
jgi:hypothetical protein